VAAKRTQEKDPQTVFRLAAVAGAGARPVLF
jgi:hypothetical protein